MRGTTTVLTLAAAAALLAACRSEATPPAPAGAIEGILRDTSGATLDQVPVRLRDPDGRSDLQTTLSGGTGRYQFVGVRPGVYDVVLSTPRGTAVKGPNPRRLTVTENQTTYADFAVTLLPVSFSHDVLPVLAGACTGCHSVRGGAPMGLKLTADDARKLTIGVRSLEHPSLQRIRAGEPDSSYLVHKIQGTQRTVGGTGAQMPQGFPPLPNQTIRMIRRWIEEGARN